MADEETKEPIDLSKPEDSIPPAGKPLSETAKRKALRRKRSLEHMHIRESKQRAYLRARETIGTIGGAAEIAGIARTMVAFWEKEEGPEADAFRAAHKAAKERYNEKMEEEADRRAMEGLRRLKFDKDGDAILDPATGEPYTEHVYSDTLLIFRLKAEAPDKYREQIGISGPTGGPVEVLHLDNLIDQELATIATRRQAEAAEPPAGDERPA